VRKFFALSFLTAIAFSLSFIANAAHAQVADRTWVSGTGDDNNACSRTAPCKTFGGAISKTSIHGEINCLDAAGFGPVTIQKSVTIDCHDVFAGITYAPASPYFAPLAIQILFQFFDGSDTAGQVILRNLNFNGLGRGNFAIDIEGATPGTMVNIEDCVIEGNAVTNGSTSSGILDQRTRGALIVNNTTVRNTAGGTGILVQAIRAVISNTRVTNSTVGIEAGTGANVVLNHSLVSNNATAGLMVGAGGVLIVDSTTISHNGNGIQNSGTVRLSNSDLILNTAAISGSVQSFTNNRFSNNGSIGTIVPIGTAANPTGQQ
jgi:Right handed beta helix region